MNPENAVCKNDFFSKENGDFQLYKHASDLSTIQVDLL